MFMVSNLNTDNGLSSSRVYSIVEAEDGAMWISTKRGVDRYNGQLVSNYTLATEMQYSDASGRNIKLTQDHHRQIYAYDNKGKVYIYNKVKDTFVLRCNLQKILGGSIVLNELLVDEKGNFWLAIDKGLYCLSASADGKEIVREKAKGRFILKNTYINHIQFVGQRLLIGTSKDVYCYSVATQKIAKKISGSSVVSSYHDVEGHHIWLGTFHEGVKVVDDRTWKPINSIAFHSLQNIPQIPVRSIISFDHQTILMAVDGAGIYAYDKLNKQTKLLLDTDGRPGNILKGNGLYTLCRDRFGDLWAGSYSGGVDLAIPMEHTLEYITHEYLNNQSLLDDCVNDVFQSRDGKIWYATDKGVSVYDSQTYSWHHGLYNKVALTICQTVDGRVLVGTYGNGVYQVNSDGTSMPAYSVSNGKLKSDYVFSLFTDSEGYLWIGCLDGDMACFPSGKNISRGVGKTAFYLPVNEVQCITESKDKRSIAVGTSHGCYLIDKQNPMHPRRFFYPGQYPDKDINFFVNSMVYQNSSHVWIGTDGGGLYDYDLTTNKFRNYTTQESLPSNAVYGLIKGKNGKLWLSTDKGLAFIYQGKVVNLNFFKGLEREYNRMSVACTSDGRMLFGSNDGVVALAPMFAKGLNYAAPLRIHRVEVEGVERTDQWNESLFEMLQEGTLQLHHHENTLIVSFESINYQYQHDIQYQYYLEGYDRNWSKLSSYQLARFVNLPPGNYVLYVKAIGRSNGRELGATSLKISIAQPWWNTWWAWIVYLCILTAILYFAWQYYKERLQRRYYDEKINFFVNTAHNIRTPLSLVLAPLVDLSKDSHLSEKSRVFLDMAQRNGNKLLKMVTELLDFQKVEQSAELVRLQDVELPMFLRLQVEKFIVAAQEKHIHLSLEACPQHLVHTDVKMMDLILENLLSNAIKYTPEGGKVTLSASIEGKTAQILVSDTGIGIPKAEIKNIFKSFFRASNAVNSQEMGSGLGLMLTRQLVKKLGGKLTFVSEEGKGTTFHVVLPLGNSAASSTQPVEEAQNVETIFSNHQDVHDEERKSVASSDDQNSEVSKDTLLFVDDNEDLRQYICMTFSDTYRVVDVESGDAALKYLEEGGECDIVVSDVMMPGMQGDVLCQRIKENKDTSWLPVILLTAKAGRNFMIEGLGLGADDYIAKPFDAAILASKIDSMLKNRHRLSQYYMERSLALVRGEVSAKSNSSKQVMDLNAADEPIETIQASDENEEQAILNPQDQAFVEKATRLVLDNLSDTDFTIDRLCREMAMSRTLFYGKLKTLTGQGPQDFMRLIRLEQAAMFLKQGDSVLDVSVKAGFVNVKYFSTVFKKHFGVSPSKYL
ncbi:two-component regulator propeller domain-containing protein [Segatella hominis]|uniref:hybrid sensor histidine kinase/response regulator transcription factor n=1 Tax=Segatella hominis TaxID=2518605 RepID=UPI003981DD18